MSVPRVHLCGQLRLEVDGESRERELRGRQGRSLFAFLVLRRERVTRREEVIAALWPEAAPGVGERALAPLLSRLRRTLGPEAIVGRGELRLDLGPDAWIDVATAQRDVAAARRALAAQRPHEALAPAREAGELTAAGLLPALVDPWIAVWRTTVEGLRTEALELHAEAGLRLGGPALAEAEDAAREAIALAPFRESAHAVLIRVLRRRGNDAEAVLAFESIRATLRDELGTAPGPALRALHQALVTPSPDREPIADRHGTTPAATAPPHDLVEREDAVRRIRASVEGLGSSRGGLVVFEGPAGLGKTRLLHELRRQAGVLGAQVLEARGAVLERDYALGVVRQLLARVARGRDLEGPVATGVAVLHDTLPVASADGLFAVFHGLVGLVRLVAEERPLVLCVDDLQWADPASLRMLAYLVNRIDDMPVLVAVTVRTGELGADDALLAELTVRAATAIAPAPLSRHAVRAMVVARLDGDPEAGFVTACTDVTAGNPLFVAQLLAALADEGVRPDECAVEAVRRVGRGAVARGVRARLARLPPVAAKVARAVAVLGEAPRPAAVAALAEVSEREAVAGLERLIAADVLRDDPLEFVHPLVRDEVLDTVPAPARALLHERAARVLSAGRASAEAVAAQLLLAPERHDPWAIERLRDAARVAARRGTPDAAVRYLLRARSEHPPPEIDAELAVELGHAAARVRGPSAVDPLREAHEAITDPDERARVAAMLCLVLLFIDEGPEAVALLEAARDELPHDAHDRRFAFDALTILAVYFDAADESVFDRVPALLAEAQDLGAAAAELKGVAAALAAIGCADADDTAALARAALASGRAAPRWPDVFGASAVLAIALADPAEGRREHERFASAATRAGSTLDVVALQVWGGFCLPHLGELELACAGLARALEAEQLWGLGSSEVAAHAAAILATAWCDRGDVARAAAALSEITRTTRRSPGVRHWHAARAEVALACGDVDGAIRICEAIGRSSPGAVHPVWSTWRSIAARALARRGDTDAAIALAHDDLALARRTGADWVVGRGLRLLAEVEGPAGIEHARAAVELLDPTSARLERAKAHAVLAQALRTAGDCDQAAGPAAAALRLGAACGAGALVSSVRGEGSADRVH